MNDTQTKELFDLLLQLQRDIGALTQQQTALAEQLTGLDQRLAHNFELGPNDAYLFELEDCCLSK